MASVVINSMSVGNHGRGSKNYVLNANSSKELGASTNAATDKAYWCFVPSADGANKYHLVSKASMGFTPSAVRLSPLTVGS